MSEQDNNLKTRSEYAKYKGVSKQMVTKWIRDKRAVLTPDEKYIMVKESDERIKLTASLNGSFYDQKAKEEKETINKIIEERGLTELSAEVSYQQLDLETDDVDILFKNARAMREKAVALQAAAEYSKFIGELVERSVAERIIFERSRQFRDGLVVFSRRVAPAVIGIESISEIESIFKKELRVMLEQFAKLPVIE